MKTERNSVSVPDLTLERYLLGELPEAEMLELEHLLEEDRGLNARVEALKNRNIEIRQRYSAALLSQQIRARLERLPSHEERRPKKTIAHLWPVPAAAAVAVLLLLTILPEGFTPREDLEQQEIQSEVRVKGLEPHLELFRKTANGSELLEDGARAREGDLIRIGYQAAGRRYGVILSVDGRGYVTLHLAQQGERAAQLEDGDTVLLDFSYELDDAPHWERFYFVVGEAPFRVGPVLKAARQLKSGHSSREPESLDIPQSLEQYVISLLKGGHDEP